MWKLGSILALFMTRYCETHGMCSSDIASFNSSLWKGQGQTMWQPDKTHQRQSHFTHLLSDELQKWETLLGWNNRISPKIVNATSLLLPFVPCSTARDYWRWRTLYPALPPVVHRSPPSPPYPQSACRYSLYWQSTALQSFSRSQLALMLSNLVQQQTTSWLVWSKQQGVAMVCSGWVWLDLVVDLAAPGSLHRTVHTGKEGDDINRPWSRRSYQKVSIITMIIGAFLSFRFHDTLR